jgi:hypothetical protein
VDNDHTDQLDNTLPDTRGSTDNKKPPLHTPGSPQQNPQPSLNQTRQTNQQQIQQNRASFQTGQSPQEKTDNTNVAGDQQKTLPPWKGGKPPSSRYTPDVHETGHIIQATVESEKPKVSKKKIIMLAVIFIVIVSISGGGGIYLYNYINNPLRIMAESYTKFDESNSFSVNAEFANMNGVADVSALLDYQKQDLTLSRVQVKIENIEKDPDHSLTGLLIFNSSEGYLQTQYSKAYEIDNLLKLSSPQITELESYKLAYPILTGKRWLYFEMSDEKGEAYESSGVEISEAKVQELNEKFIESIVINSHNSNFEIDGKKYHKILIGFDKEKLINFVETFKDLDLEVELKDINALVRVIISIDNWNSNIVEIVIEKDTSYPHSIALWLPQIPEDALEEGIKESISDESSASRYLDLFSESIDKLMDNKDEEARALNYIGKLTFSNYNRAPGAERPKNIVSREVLTEAIEKDVPTLMLMFLQTTTVPDELYFPNDAPFPLPSTQSSSLQEI